MATSPITFETGDLTQFDATTTPVGLNSIAASAASAMYGNFGMQANIVDQNAVTGKANQPNASRIRVGFFFDPNGLTMANGDKFRICGGGTAGDSDYAVEVSYDGADYQVRIDLETDGGWVDSAPFTITDAKHWIEIDCFVAANPGDNDGFGRLWVDVVDGTADTEVINQDNDTTDFDDVNLGAGDGIDVGTSGIAYFDHLTWNVNGDRIGPPPSGGYAWIF
jgi:hypothetical protein